MSKRHDWRHNPQERSLEPVETGEDFEAECMVEEGEGEPQAEASGELASIIEDARGVAAHWEATTIEPGYAENAAASTRVLAYLKALAARPAPRDDTALREALEGEIVYRCAICHYVPKCNSSEACAHVSKLRALLAHEAPKDSQP